MNAHISHTYSENEAYVYAVLPSEELVRRLNEQTVDPKDFGIDVRMVQVDPVLAKLLLDRNTLNRHMARARVDHIADSMSKGNWMVNGETIIQDNRGILISGQHRLQAIIDSGSTIPLLIVSGVDPDARKTVDSGRRRTVGDNLAMMGIQYSSAISAMAPWIEHISSGKFIHRGGLNRMDTTEVLQWYNSDRERINLAAYLSVKASKFLYPSIGGAVALCFIHIDQVKAEKFFNQLIEGNDLVKGHPIYTLRNRLIDIALEKGKTRPAEIELIAMTINSWNAWIENRQLFASRGSTIVKVGEREEKQIPIPLKPRK